MALSKSAVKRERGLSRLDLSLILEALRTARCEIETIEKEFDEYCTTGRLIDQLVAAEAIVLKEKDRRLAKSQQPQYLDA